MTRREKYPDTRTFRYFNANPHGKLTCDCTTRAISTAAEKPYNDVLVEMFSVQMETGYEYSSREAIAKYLQQLGWVKHKQPRKDNGTKYTGKEFCRKLADPKVNYIANIGGNHIVAIIGGKVNDTWDSTDGCIGNYWTKG